MLYATIEVLGSLPSVAPSAALRAGSFVLTNCRFASRQNDRADMRFVAGSGASIRNIRLALISDRQP